LIFIEHLIKHLILTIRNEEKRFMLYWLNQSHKSIIKMVTSSSKM